MKKALLVFVTFLSINFVIAQNGKEPVLLTDMLKIRTAGNLVVNNAGTVAAFTVTSIEPEEKKEGEYKYVTQIHKVDLSTNAAPVQMTFGKESSSQPAWSPDDKSVFIAVLNRAQNHMKLNQFDAASGAFVKTIFEVSLSRKIFNK